MSDEITLFNHISGDFKIILENVEIFNPTNSSLNEVNTKGLAYTAYDKNIKLELINFRFSTSSLSNLIIRSDITNTDLNVVNNGENTQISINSCKDKKISFNNKCMIPCDSNKCFGINCYLIVEDSTPQCVYCNGGNSEGTNEEKVGLFKNLSCSTCNAQDTNISAGKPCSICLNKK